MKIHYFSCKQLEFYLIGFFPDFYYFGAINGGISRRFHHKVDLPAISIGGQGPSKKCWPIRNHYVRIGDSNLDSGYCFSMYQFGNFCNLINFWRAGSPKGTSLLLLEIKTVLAGLPASGGVAQLVRASES